MSVLGEACSTLTVQERELELTILRIQARIISASTRILRLIVGAAVWEDTSIIIIVCFDNNN